MADKIKTQKLLSRKARGNVPIDYMAHHITDRKLKEFYCISSEKELLDKLGSDFYYLSCRDISQNESLKTIYVGPEIEYTDQSRNCPFGMGWTRGAYQSKFTVDEALYNPLGGAQSEKDILEYSWPKVEWFEFDHFYNEIESNSDRIIVGGFWSGILGDAYRMHGFENFLLNTAVKPKMIKTLVSRMTDFYLELNQKLFGELGNKIDIWFFGNDLGSQSGLLLSPKMIEDFFFDNFKKLCSLAHSYDIRVMMHSCGAIYEIIPMLIEAGVEILDPIQVTAKGMQSVKLKKTFGDKLIFHGGIDTQNILPNGTIQEVRKHCIETINTLGPEGYIFSPSQILGPDIPVENISTMYETAKKYNKVQFYAKS